MRISPKNLTGLLASSPLFASTAFAQIDRVTGEQYVFDELQYFFSNAVQYETIQHSQPSPYMNNEEFLFAATAHDDDNPSLCVNSFGIDYMATTGPEIENKSALKDSIDVNALIYQNIPQMADEESIRHAVRAFIGTYCPAEVTSTREPVVKASQWGRVKAGYRR